MKKSFLTLTLLLFATNALASGSRGGANGIDGKPLESYVVDITKTSEYRRYIEPIMLQLREKLPALADRLQTVVQRKDFYFVPIALPEIERHIVGVFFRTDQLALQTTYSVWVDKKLYDPNDERENATTQLHEMIMGIRIADKQKAALLSYFDLSAGDYEQIRALNNLLLNRLGSYDAQALEEAVQDLGFLPKAPADVTYDPGVIGVPPTITDLYLALASEQRRGSLPNVTCGYKFLISADASNLHIQIYPAAGGRPQFDRLPMTIDVDKIEVSVIAPLKTVAYQAFSQPIEVGGITFVKRFEIEFVDGTLTKISLNWMENIYNYRTRQYRWEKSTTGPHITTLPTEMICI